MPRHVWHVMSFDPSIPMTLSLVLDSDDPRTAELVEQAAHQWGVVIEREGGNMSDTETPSEPTPTEPEPQPDEPTPDPTEPDEGGEEEK